MEFTDSISLSIANNNFGNNVTIYQGNVQNPVAGQAEQCLADLRPTDPRDDKSRIQQTKGGLLKESYDWIIHNETFKQWRDDEQSRMLWIKGDPGKGKTMLLCGIIDELLPRTKLARPVQTTETFLSYFFCQGTDSRINNATAVLRGLIYLIIIQEPSLISHVQEKYNHTGKDLFQDKNALVAVLDILQNILHDTKLEKIVFVIDALDECETDSPKLLDFITRNTSLTHIKWILSSRNILSIQQKLESHVLQGILSLELKANADYVSQAVDTYIEHSLSRLRTIQHDQRLREELKIAIQRKANGTFLWASLVIKELEGVQSWEVLEVVEGMPMDLAAVYRRMIGQIQHLRRGNPELCWSILSTMFTAYYPISLMELGILSGLPSWISASLESIINLTAMCGSFLTIRERTVYFIHQSAKDFLSAEVFHFNAAQRDADIYKHSVAAISKLPQNICRLPDFGFRPKDEPPPTPNPLDSMRYSCFCWADHFCDAYGANLQSETKEILEETLWSFLKDYVLRWLESMCLLCRLPDGLRSIQKILRELQFEESSQLLRFLRGIEKFIINNGSIIDRAPLQIYGSALVFSQTTNDIKQQQWKERLPFIENVQGVIKTNSAVLQTLEGHGQRVNAIGFSLNGEMMVSGSNEGTIRVWDTATGAIQHTLTSHAGSILAVSISPDCTTLVFVSSHEYSTFNRDDDVQIRLVNVSIDAKTPGARLHDSTIRLNDATAYGQSQVLRQDYFSKAAVASFSLDGKTLAATFEMIELWNAETGVRLRAFQNIGKQFTTIAFSPDSKTIASMEFNGKVRLWQVETGACFRTFDYYPIHSWVPASAFQPDGKKLALGEITGSGAMLLLDLATGTYQETCIGHGRMHAIAFSPDSETIASGSDDNTIRLWDAELGTQQQTIKDVNSQEKIAKMVFSPDGKILATIPRDGPTIQLWDTSSGTRRQAFGVAERAEAIAFSPDGRTLAAGSRGGVWLWDVATGQRTYLQALNTHHHGQLCNAIAFSPDGRKLAWDFESNGTNLQDLATGEIQRRFIHAGYNESTRAMAFSPDGRMLAALYQSGEIQVWDVATGLWLRNFPSSLPGSAECTSIMFLRDGPFLCINNGYVQNWLQPDAEPPKHDLLLVAGEWITKGGKRLLWLPREYRTDIVAVHGNVVAIGGKSEVVFLWFNF